MSMDAGDNTVQPNTMAKAIYDALTAEFGATTGDQDVDRKKGCAAIAAGVVAHLAGFADVRVTTSDGGIQKTTTTGADTDPPDSDVVLSGALE